MNSRGKVEKAAVAEGMRAETRGGRLGWVFWEDMEFKKGK